MNKKPFFLGAFLVGSILLVGAGCRTSEERYGNNMMERDQMMVMEYMMEDGSMMTKAEDDKLRPMTVDVTLSDGTKIMTDGKVMKKDGETMMLKEGESITRDGVVKTSEKMEKKMMDDSGKNEMPGGDVMKGGENTSTEKMMMDDAKVKGSYQAYDPSKLALAEKGNVVLFFHAPWCPHCRTTDADILKSTVPDGLTILKVDYDSSAELKKKYGVTYQHTFVKVDKNGNLLKKWSGSATLNDIVAQVQ